MFNGWPIVSGFYYASLDWSGFSKSKEFVGFANFVEVARDPYFWNAYRNSFAFMLGVLPIHVVVGLLIAIVLNRKDLRFAVGYRTLFFLPVVTTAAIVGIIMIFILAADGPVNKLLLLSKAIGKPLDFLGNPKLAMGSVIVISGWKNLGTNIVYWLAALQGIPDELYEAATVDGCGGRRLFRHITLPLILPMGAVIALLNVIGSLKAFDLIKTMTNGGPFFATDMVATYIYRFAFSSEVGVPRVGYATAAGIFFGITIIVVGAASNALAERIKSGAAK
jgi:multiple sugar transport system permease protein